ncbi:hypothetical protein GBAR_LOCUS10225, partial [Geodia barretti]
MEQVSEDVLARKRPDLKLHNKIPETWPLYSPVGECVTYSLMTLLMLCASPMNLLTLSAHAQQGLQYLVRKCVYLSVCLLPRFLPPHA